MLVNASYSWMRDRNLVEGQGRRWGDVTVVHPHAFTREWVLPPLQVRNELFGCAARKRSIASFGKWKLAVAPVCVEPRGVGVTVARASSDGDDRVQLAQVSPVPRATQHYPHSP